MIELARRYGRYGYRRIAALLRDAGWQVNDKRVERLWRREGLKVSGKQPKRGRLWLNDGSCVRLRAERADHVWSYDFVHHRTHDGRSFRTLNVLDEFTRESLAIRVRQKLSSADVVDVLTDLFILRGVPAYIRSDNGPEFVAEAVRRWIAAVGARTAFVEPGSPWENGYIESFSARLRGELLNGEIFYTLKKAQVLIEAWRRHYNAIRPHGSLGYRPPAPAAYRTEREVVRKQRGGVELWRGPPPSATTDKEEADDALRQEVGVVLDFLRGDSVGTAALVTREPDYGVERGLLGVPGKTANGHCVEHT